MSRICSSSTRMRATLSGWLMYSSLLFRSWSRWTLVASPKALVSLTTSSVLVSKNFSSLAKPAFGKSLIRAVDGLSPYNWDSKKGKCLLPVVGSKYGVAVRRYCLRLAGASVVPVVEFVVQVFAHGDCVLRAGVGGVGQRAKAGC